MRVFFGHQSVGWNILEGLGNLGSGVPPVLRLKDHPSPTGSFLLHEELGGNGGPQGKFQAFLSFFREARAPEVDVALFKLCYVDFHRHSDVENIFADYAETVAAFKALRPLTTFVHATVPLTAVSAKDRILSPLKLMLGRPHPEGANIARNAFNDRLRDRFSREPIFDIASEESTRPDGTAETFDDGGRARRCLVKAYTADGGHLNDEGSRRLARAMWKVLESARR